MRSGDESDVVGEVRRALLEKTLLDEIREYWDRQPCNINYSFKPIGTREYFDEVEARKYFVEPHIPGFAQFERWAGKRVLEIGCGIGTDAVNFARAGAIYTGADISEKSINIVHQRFQIYKLRGSLQRVNVEDRLPLELVQLRNMKIDVARSVNYDLIYSFGVLHHTPEPNKVLELARKSIAPDGELRVMVYARDSWKAAMIEAGLDQPEAQDGCPLARTYTRKGAEAMLNVAGFEVVSMEQAHIFPYRVGPYKRGVYEKEAWFDAMPADIFAALERRFGWHLLIVGRPI